ncbi:TIGR02757 family protein [Helicobacter canis NCTC 12740]|uniref:TIGR02757 family protein n=2 Tax=Helicobacter canis TaxID=29419 RepID=V8CJ96_9HELI|nr:TIGR02757 family protein [Helicobacter canis NCTC 12740]
MNHASLQELLDSAYYAHNRAGAISEQNLDPLLVVYENSTRENLPAIALVCALFAYGNVGAIVGFLRKLDFSLLGGDSALGNHSGDFVDFRATADHQSSSALKSTKSPTSTTATPRILEEENQAFKSLRGDTIAEAIHTNARKLDSSIEEMDSKETSPNGERCPLFCHALPSDKARNDNKKVDSRVKAGVLATPQAKADSSKQVQALSKQEQDSRICDEKCGLQGKSQGSYLDGNDRRDFSPLPHLSRKAESFRLENILCATFPYYRFQTSNDVKLLFASLACIIAQGGLESSFSRKAPPLAVISAISQAICSHASRILASPLYAPFFSHDYCARFLASRQFSQGFSFLVGFSPSSPLKRWNMFLRWLTRKDHIDLGLWQDLLSPSDLLLPLDTHTLRISRALTLLQRKSYDRKAVLEVSAALKRFCAHDPIRYDFALYRIGQSGAWLKQLES